MSTNGEGSQKISIKTVHVVYGWPLRWITWKYSITYVFPYWFDIRTTGWHAWETMIYGFDFERLSVPYILIVALKKMQRIFYVIQVLLRNGIHIDKFRENRKWHSRDWYKKYHSPRKIHNFHPIIMKFGEIDHLMRRWNCLNIRLIRQKSRIFCLMHYLLTSIFL